VPGNKAEQMYTYSKNSILMEKALVI